MEYELVREYIEALELSEQLEPVAYHTSLALTSESVVQGLYINDEAFKEAVSQLLIIRYPVLTGTLNYAYALQNKGELGTLSKEKVKKRYENKVR